MNNENDTRAYELGRLTAVIEDVVTNHDPTHRAYNFANIAREPLRIAQVLPVAMGIISRCNLGRHDEMIAEITSHIDAFPHQFLPAEYGDFTIGYYTQKNEFAVKGKRTEIANKIVELRERNNMTQEKLSDKSGVSLRTVKNIEAGAFGARLDVLERILRALNATIDIRPI